MRSMARWCRRCGCGGQSSLVAPNAPTHLLLRVDHAAFELERADHRTAHPSDEVALEPVRCGDSDHVASLACLVRDPLDRVIRRVTFASEDDVYTLHRLFRVGQ